MPARGESTTTRWGCDSALEGSCPVSNGRWLQQACLSGTTRWRRLAEEENCWTDSAKWLMAEGATDKRVLRHEEPIEIANEFAIVHVRKVHTPNGERLEIEAPRRGRLIRLDPLELESIACHDDEAFACSSEVLAEAIERNKRTQGEENHRG